MVTLFGAFVGFLGSVFPDILKLFRDAADRKHELTLLEMQMEQQRLGHKRRLKEISLYTDISESKALYKTYNTGIRWVDALNGTVRPVLAYAFFFLYAIVKAAQFSLISHVGTAYAITLLWSQEDQAIFAGIISFYFGQRAMSKLRQNR